MKERIEKIIDELTKHRDTSLEEYLKVLESYDGSLAADYAGFVHDLDRHITNLHLELKRLTSIARLEVVNA